MTVGVSTTKDLNMLLAYFVAKLQSLDLIWSKSFFLLIPQLSLSIARLFNFGKAKECILFFNLDRE